MNWWKIASASPKAVWLEGELKQQRDGFVYVDVPDSIIAPFMRMLPKEVEHPDSASDKFSGAHITVMGKSELDGKRLTEVGTTIRFQLMGLASVKPDGWEGVKEVFFLQVDSPDLEKLRQKYDLSKKHKGHDYHITVGLIRS